MAKKGKQSASRVRKPPGGQIPARTELQRYGMGGPLTSYQDMPRLCLRCLRPFTFTAEEQQHWYEVLRFTIDSIPNECAPCRLLLRRARRAQDRLTVLLTAPKPETAEEMLEAALLLALLGRTRRARELHSRGRRLLGEQAPQRKPASLIAKYQAALEAPELGPALKPPLRCQGRHLHLLFVVIHEAWAHDRRLPQGDLAMRLLESHRWQRVGRWTSPRYGDPEKVRADLESGGWGAALLIMYESLGAFRLPGRGRTAADTAMLAPLRADLPLTPADAAAQLRAMCGPDRPAGG